MMNSLYLSNYITIVAIVVIKINYNILFNLFLDFLPTCMVPMAILKALLLVPILPKLIIVHLNHI